MKLVTFARDVYAPGLHFAFAAAWYLGLEGTLVLESGQAWRLDLRSVAGVSTLFFALFFLRVVDEIKDYDYDRLHNPDRPLVRGSVTRRDLAWFLIGSSALALLSNAWISWWLVLVVVADLAWGLVLLELEKRSRFIRDSMFANLIVTYPVNVALSVYTWLSVLERSNTAPNAGGALIVVAYALAFLHYEIARKTQWPEAAKEGERLYSREVGACASVLLSLGSGVVACAILIALFRPWEDLGAMAVVSWLPVLPVAPAALGSMRFFRAPGARSRLAPLAMLFLLLFYGSLLARAFVGEVLT